MRLFLAHVRGAPQTSEAVQVRKQAPAVHALLVIIVTEFRLL